MSSIAFHRKHSRHPRLMLFVALAAFSCLASLLAAGSAAAAISISQPANISLPAIPGTGGSSEGSVTWRVSVSALLGYFLTVNASSAPAMSQNGYTIPDYPASTPQLWSVAATEAAFGFSAEGNDTSTSTWGTPSTGAGKYRGFNGANPIQIASAGLLSSGADTTVYFKGEVGSSYFAVSGTYTASITATATAGL